MQATLEQMLEHSDLFSNRALYDEIKKRYKALQWTIRGKKNYIHLTKEVRSLDSSLRIHSHVFCADNSLLLNTTKGVILFYNP